MSVSLEFPYVAPAPWRVSVEGGVVRLEGELDMVTAPALEDVLGDAVDGVALTIDLRALEFMDCAGLQVLLAASERARNAGRRLEVIPGAGAPARLLRLCELDGALACTSSPTEAPTLVA